MGESPVDTEYSKEGSPVKKLSLRDWRLWGRGLASKERRGKVPSFMCGVLQAHPARQEELDRQGNPRRRERREGLGDGGE